MIFFLFVLCCIIGIIIWHIELAAFLWASWLALSHLTWLSWALAHPWQVVFYAAGYFLIGAVWSIIKWWFAETERVRQAKEKFRKQKSPLTWVEFRMKSDPAGYKSDILMWISFWPCSAIATLFDDPVRRLCRRIYNELQGVYQRITDSVWK